MKRKRDSLVALLNLNGSLYRGVAFREPYHFSHLYHHREMEPQREGGDLLGLGDILVEKLKRIKSLHGALKNFGISPYLEKLFKRGAGQTF